MSFQGMGKSINPMCDFLKPKPQGETMTGSALRLIVLMSLQPAIPWRVALLHCPPPLHRLDTILHRPANFVNHHPAGAGEFSTGTMGNFQPELTHPAQMFMGVLRTAPLIARVSPITLRCHRHSPIGCDVGNAPFCSIGNLYGPLQN